MLSDQTHIRQNYLYPLQQLVLALAVQLKAHFLVTEQSRVAINWNNITNLELLCIIYVCFLW